MNKVITSVVFGLAVSAPGMAQADSKQGQQLVECREQLAVLYGEDTRVRLRGRAAGRESILKFSVYPDGEYHLRVSCARLDNGLVNLTDRHGVALLAPTVDTEELVAMETDTENSGDLASR